MSLLQVSVENILYSKDPFPSNYPALHPTWPAIPPCLPFHPTCHPTLPGLPAIQPANQPNLPVSAKLPCPPTLQSHVGMVYIERDQGSPHPPAQTLCVNAWLKSLLHSPQISYICSKNFLNTPQNILYTPPNILCYWLCTPPKILCTPPKILHTPTKILHTPS